MGSQQAVLPPLRPPVAPPAASGGRGWPARGGQFPTGSASPATRWSHVRRRGSGRPRAGSPSVTPVAAKKTSSPATRAVGVEDPVEVVAGVLGGLRCLVVRGQSLPRTGPPMHLIAEAESTPSGVPPKMPQSRSMPVLGITANSDAAASPSEMKRWSDPPPGASPPPPGWRGRSSMITVTSPGSPPLRLAIFRTTSSSGSFRLSRSAARGPVTKSAPCRRRGPRSDVRAALRGRDHRQRGGHPAGRRRRTLDGIDRDVDARRAAVADLPRRCRAWAPRASRPRRSPRCRPWERCRAWGGSRQPQAPSALPSRPRPTQQPRGGTPPPSPAPARSTRLRSQVGGSRTSCEITCCSGFRHQSRGYSRTPYSAATKTAAGPTFLAAAERTTRRSRVAFAGRRRRSRRLGGRRRGRSTERTAGRASSRS